MLVIQDVLLESRKRTKEWDESDFKAVQKAYDDIHARMTACLEKELSPHSDEVQEIVRDHLALTEKFYSVNREVYQGLAELYSKHPDFRKIFEKHHPDLASFLAEAMRFFTRTNL